MRADHTGAHLEVVHPDGMLLRRQQLRALTRGTEAMHACGEHHDQVSSLFRGPGTHDVPQLQSRYRISRGQGWHACAALLRSTPAGHRGGEPARQEWKLNIGLTVRRQSMGTCVFDVDL